MSQLEEAKKLKECIDRRSVTVSNILYKYLSSEEYADYDHFINMKAKLIMDSKEISDKIKLGEEQLLALKETLIVADWFCVLYMFLIVSHCIISHLIIRVLSNELVHWLSPCFRVALDKILENFHYFIFSFKLSSFS